MKNSGTQEATEAWDGGVKLDCLVSSAILHYMYMYHGDFIVLRKTLS